MKEPRVRYVECDINEGFEGSGCTGGSLICDESGYVTAFPRGIIGEVEKRGMRSRSISLPKWRMVRGNLLQVFMHEETSNWALVCISILCRCKTNQPSFWSRFLGWTRRISPEDQEKFWVLKEFLKDILDDKHQIR